MLIPNAVAIGPGRASLSPCDRKQPASGFDSATRVFQGSPASAFTIAPLSATRSEGSSDNRVRPTAAWFYCAFSSVWPFAASPTSVELIGAAAATPVSRSTALHLGDLRQALDLCVRIRFVTNLTMASQRAWFRILLKAPLQGPPKRRFSLSQSISQRNFTLQRFFYSPAVPRVPLDFLNICLTSSCSGRRTVTLYPPEN